jgi:uncharacterized protein YjiS (DUF1127 family)
MIFGSLCSRNICDVRDGEGTMGSAMELQPPLGRPPAPLALRLAAGMLTWLFLLFERLAEWQERARQRRHLQALDDRLLHDIGFSHADVEREARKRFWMR